MHENEVLSRESKEWSNTALFGYVAPKIILVTGVPGHPECEGMPFLVTRKTSKNVLVNPHFFVGASFSLSVLTTLVCVSSQLLRNN